MIQPESPIPQLIVNKEPWPELCEMYPEPERVRMHGRSSKGSFGRQAGMSTEGIASGVQSDGRWNFIHSHVGNRKTRRAAKAKARRAAWKARKP